MIGSGDPDDFADPVPQALVLTAIVISFGTTALLLALAYRSWLLTSDDEVADDVEDRMVGASDYHDVEVADETLLIDEAEAGRRTRRTRRTDRHERRSARSGGPRPSGTVMKALSMRVPS